MKEYIFTILFFISLLSYSFCVEQITFTVEGVETQIMSCSEIGGSYSFKINGNFSGTPSILDRIYIDLKSPSKAQAECTPFDIGYSYLYCVIDVCLNSMISANIILPVDAPIDNIYKFVSWEDIIGKIDGETNKVAENVTCIPKPENTFIPSSIESKGCSEKNNVFIINGDWEDKSLLPEVSFDFKIRIDNEQTDIAACSYNKTNTNEFNCQFEGEGTIKFEEKIFKGAASSYTMQKTDVSTNVRKCGNSHYMFLSLGMMIIFGLLIL